MISRTNPKIPLIFRSTAPLSFSAVRWIMIPRPGTWSESGWSSDQAWVYVLGLRRSSNMAIEHPRSAWSFFLCENHSSKWWICHGWWHWRVDFTRNPKHWVWQMMLLLDMAIVVYHVKFRVWINVSISPTLDWGLRMVNSYSWLWGTVCISDTDCRLHGHGG